MAIYTRISSTLAALAAVGLLSTAAHALNETPGNGTQAIPLVSGGIGEEMDYLKSIQKEYSLKLMFVETDGAYLADIPVTIKDKQGQTVVNTVSDGPVLLLKLPAGTYTVTATDKDATREHTLSVSRSLSTYQFHFPQQAEQVSSIQ